MEALESHYFHIPYPGALGLLRECGRPGAGKAQGCGGNLRPCARLQGEMSPSCITLGSVPEEGDHASGWGGGDGVSMLMQLSLHQTIPQSENWRVKALRLRKESDMSAEQLTKLQVTMTFTNDGDVEVFHKLSHAYIINLITQIQFLGWELRVGDIISDIQHCYITKKYKTTIIML